MRVIRPALAFVSLIVAGCGGAPAAPDDGGAPDLGPPVLAGKQLYAGRAHVAGVTSDGWAAVLDDDRGALAVSLAGASAQPIDPGADLAVASGRLILAVHSYDPLVGAGDATLWSAAGGARPIASGWIASQQASSDDGRRLLLAEHVAADGKSADLVLIATATGAATTLWAQIAEVAPCRPRFGFAAGRFVVTHCTAGSPAVTVSSVDAATGAAVDLLAPAKNFFSIDRAGKHVLVASDAGDPFVVPIAGGAAAPLAGPGGVVFGEFVPDGSAAILRAGASLVRASTDGKSATTLVSDGVAAFLGAAPDGAHVLYASNLDPDFGWSDLHLAATDAPAAPLTLSAATDGLTFGSGFTSDGTRAVYVTGANALGAGTLASQPVAGGAATVHGAAVWRALPAGATRIVWSDHFVPVPKQNGRADLLSANCGGADAPALLATRADALFFLALGRTAAVYAFNDGGPLDGVYLAPLP